MNLASLNLEPEYVQGYKDAYKQLKDAVPKMNVFLPTYFDGLRDNTDLAFSLPVQA